METTAKSDVDLNENESLKSKTCNDINESREENKR